MSESKWTKQKGSDEGKQGNIADLEAQCKSILENAGFNRISVHISEFWSLCAMEVAGFRDDLKYKLRFSSSLGHFRPEDKVIIMLAKSLCEIDFTDRNKRESQMWTYFSMHGCIILGIRGVEGNCPSVDLQGAGLGIGTIYYDFDIDEYEARRVKIAPQSSIEEFRNKCSEHLEKTGFYDVDIVTSNAYKAIDISFSKGNIRYTYHCEFNSSNDTDRFSLKDNAVQDVILNSMSAIEGMKYSKKRDNVKILKELYSFFEKNQYRFVKIFFDEVNNYSIFVTKYKVSFSILVSIKERAIVNYEQHTNSLLAESFDTMDGLQFESFCARVIEQNGYESVSVTSGSGDQGIDIIAYRDGIKYGIQCKCYSSAVGNKAVQEVLAGKTFYHCHVGVVLTNNYFTSSAIELARSNGIALWDRDRLLQMIQSASESLRG